jgi:FkbM family methyltransferase
MPTCTGSELRLRPLAENFTRLMKPATLEGLLVSYARHFPVRRGKLRLIDSFWRVAVVDASAMRLASLKHGGFKMQCDLNEMLQRQFYFFGTYFLEEDALACWEKAARGAKVIFDVGANAGIYGLAALANQPDATVHAFEPTPEIAARLRATAKLNGLDHLYIHEVAVSSKNGRATLKRCRGELGTNGGMNYIVSGQPDSEVESVQTVCLDQFCEDHAIDRIDLLKLDIQGHEHMALAGAARLIRADRVGLIFTELNWVERSGAVCPATESIRLLEGAGYRFSRPAKNLNWKKAGDWLRTVNDVVASRVRP